MLGTLAVMDKRPLPKEPRGMALLQIFADRAAAELQRLRAEAALWEREERYRDLYDEAPIAYQSVGVDGRIRSANRRAAELFGYPLNELIGRSVQDFVAPEDRDQVRTRASSGFEGPYQHVALRADGSRFPVEVRARSIPYRGRTVRVTALRDVSERAQSEERQRRLEACECSIACAAGVGPRLSTGGGPWRSMWRLAGMGPSS